MDTYYVYMLRCQGNTLYTGTTPDIKKRIRTHYLREKGCAKFTKSHPVESVAMVWKTDGKSAALRAEYFIKTLSRKEKEELLLSPETLSDFFGEKLAEFNFIPCPLSLEDSLKGEDEMNNIVLIGMPGAGKSTVGVILAKTLGFQFIDTDLLIQTKAGKKLQEIIDTDGLDSFINLENEVISNLQAENAVIATGGSAVLGSGAKDALRRLGKVVYLEVPLRELKRRLYNIKTRGIAMKKGETIGDVFSLRAPLYEESADMVVRTKGKSAEQVVEEIEESFQK